MENKAIKEEEEATNPYKYKLLDLIPNERKKWVMKSEDGGGETRNHRFPSNESKLELRLGLPGAEEEESKAKKREGYDGNYNQAHNNPLSMGYFSSVTSCQWSYAKENSSQPCKSRMMELSNNDKKNKIFPSSANTDVATNSHKRASCGAVVGWPPVRSSRRNLASSSSAKPVPTPPSAPPPIKASEKPAEMSHKGLFVKINMEGVPIGRKVDLTAYDNYDKLCFAVDTLFRGLLAGLLDESGEYTLVYEDHEGDRMLVGDVPWNMFVSTVKRLRVLKRSQLPSLRKVGDKGVQQLKVE
ncbi:hypothetical protein V2J09_004689 [Rumex salicifolius]